MSNTSRARWQKSPAGRAYHKAYRQKHGVRMQEQTDAWKAAHRAHVLAYGRQYNAEHRGQRKKPKAIQAAA